jgi:hypothetical protein
MESLHPIPISNRIAIGKGLLIGVAMEVLKLTTTIDEARHLNLNIPK